MLQATECEGPQACFNPSRQQWTHLLLVGIKKARQAGKMPGPGQPKPA